MSRITSCFSQLKAQGKKALIPYITAGDPQQGVTVNLMHAMVASGADIIELGVPFSDPMADGPVIQLACERALAANTRLVDVLAMVSEFRQTNQQTPVVLMGYLNPVEAMGYDRFVREAKAAGVDGVLTVDLPPEESQRFGEQLKTAGLDPIFLLAPTTTESRMKTICAAGSGYVYYVSVKGVTGSSALNSAEVGQRVEQIRSVTDMPVGVGFGIKDAASAAAIGAVSDGVIVGSVLVNQIAALAETPEQIAPAISQIMTELRAGLDAL